MPIPSRFESAKPRCSSCGRLANTMTVLMQVHVPIKNEPLSAGTATHFNIKTTRRPIKSTEQPNTSQGGNNWGELHTFSCPNKHRWVSRIHSRTR